jgi:uncharacterized protein YcfJ
VNVRFAPCLAASLFTLAAPAWAQPTTAAPVEHAPELARVVSVTPNLVRVAETRQECAIESREVAGGAADGLAGSVIGALAGAALGSRAGKGTGRMIATSAGAALGAEVGARMAASPPRTESVQVCRAVPVARDVVRDYTVRYEWNGREYATLMAAPPAGFVRVEASHRATAM